MTFSSITNRGEFFSNHYLDAVIGGDLGDLRKAWDEAEGKSEPSARSTLRGSGSGFFAARATASEATGDRASEAIRSLNDVVLKALGFTPQRETLDLVGKVGDLNGQRGRPAEARREVVVADRRGIGIGEIPRFQAPGREGRGHLLRPDRTVGRAAGIGWGRRQPAPGEGLKVARVGQALAFGECEP